MTEIFTKYISPYLPYNLQCEVQFTVHGKIIEPLVGIKHGEYLIGGKRIDVNDWEFKPIFRPLSDLLKQITHNGITFIPVEWFEIGDEVNNCPEYTPGNIRLIKNLETIASHNIYHDINFLAYGVVEKLLEWHFDIYGLIEANLAVPYKKS